MQSKVRYGFAGSAVTALLVTAGCSGHSSASHDSTAPTASGGSSARTSVSASRAPAATTSPTAPASGGAEGASTESTASCQIASTATVEKVLSASVSSATGAPSPIGQQCQFVLARSVLGTRVTVFLSQASPTTPASFAAAKKSALAHGAVAIAGLGDDAYYTVRAANLQYLSATSAGAAQAQGATAPAAAVRGALVSLARAILANQ